MILQTLKEYYDRKITDPDGGIAPDGFEYKEIPFVVVLDAVGNVVQIEDTRTKVGTRSIARSFLVPQSVKRTGGVKANLFWDNVEYTLGIFDEEKLAAKLLSVENIEEKERVEENFRKRIDEQHSAFIKRIECFSISSDDGVNAILKFMRNGQISELQKREDFLQMKKENPFISFRLNSDPGLLVSNRPSVIAEISQTPSDGKKGLCLVTGELDNLCNLHPSIKGIRDANSTGANIVSFNLAAFNSFGKTQGKNAPIGEKAVFSYTTALNHLLRRDSSQKIQVGDATTIFWSDKQTPLEGNFCSLFDEPPKDNPDRLVTSVMDLYSSINTGAAPNESLQAKFFVLGLSPNAARISIRFWHAGTIAEFSQRICQYFTDLTLIHAPYEKDYLSLWRLLRSIAVQGKMENVPPNLAGDWMRSILAGTAYPDSLFQAALRRVRSAESNEKDSYARVAIIKAYLNRKTKFHPQQEKEITVSLDKNNRNSGYRLGRLFAALEKIQENASGGNLNATIRDRYYGAASSTPASVFPILMRLKNHHVGKLERPGEIYFESLLGEIIGEVNEFPSQFNLYDQGRFAIGYYHQRQEFFLKS